MVPTTIRKEAPTGNAPMGAIPPKAVINHFPQIGGNQTTEASELVFDPTQGDRGMETPPPNDSLQAQTDWLANKCYVLYVLPILVRAPLIRSGYKDLQKDLVLVSCIQSLLSKNAIERVENVKSLGF